MLESQTMDTSQIDSLFLCQKRIYHSMFIEGFAIDAKYQPLVHAALSSRLQVGETRTVKIELGGELFDVKLTNQYFNREQHPEHREEIMRFSYSKTSPFALKMQQLFPDAYALLHAEYLLPKGQRRRMLTLPEGWNDSIVLYATPVPDVFAIECYWTAEHKQMEAAVQQMTEQEYELIDARDDTAGIVVKTALQKVRHLDRSIGNSLKKLYDYRCQVTGEKIGDEYGGSVIEVHHIDYFTRSLNNDSTNIIIISPNFHRIIHKNNPVFNRQALSFEFPNGVVEKVQLNKHL